MLRSPFRTTRTQKVPMHSRIGHRERITNALFLSIIRIIVIVTIAGFLLWFMR